MKRLMIALIALALSAGLVPALAVELPAGCIELTDEQIEFIDLDGDGYEEEVTWSMEKGEYGDCMALSVLSGGDQTIYWTDIIYSDRAYVTDLDGDGLPEVLLTGDVASDDYYTHCLQYQGGRLTEALFPDGERGENTDGYFSPGYGLVTRVTDYYVELTGSQDVLGTWMAYRWVSLDPATGRFEFCDNGLWERPESAYDDEADLWEYAALTVKSPIAYTGEHGWPDGVLSPGDKLLVYATDKQYEAYFITPDDVTGILSISPNYEQGWGWLVDGVPEEDCFEYVPYAD